MPLNRAREIKIEPVPGDHRTKGPRRIPSRSSRIDADLMALPEIQHALLTARRPARREKPWTVRERFPERYRSLRRIVAVTRFGLGAKDCVKKKVLQFSLHRMILSGWYLTLGLCVPFLAVFMRDGHLEKKQPQRSNKAPWCPEKLAPRQVDLSAYG